MRSVPVARPRRSAKRSHQLAAYRLDKKLWRLPAPFYRAPSWKVVPGPGAEPAVLVTAAPIANVHDSVLFTARVVRGWIVARKDTVNGYYVDSASASFETLSAIRLDPAEEGTLWARGWDDETFAAVNAAMAMI